jgi:copper chaperone CopZ
MEKINAASWKVDLSHPDRILTVEGEVATETIIDAIEKSGYKAESF